MEAERVPEFGEIFEAGLIAGDLAAREGDGVEATSLIARRLAQARAAAIPEPHAFALDELAAGGWEEGAEDRLRLCVDRAA